MKNFLDILNKDEKAKKLHTKFNQLAKEQGLTGEAYNEAKKTFITMIIFQNKEALYAMADEIYDGINGVQS